MYICVYMYIHVCMCVCVCVYVCVCVCDLWLPVRTEGCRKTVQLDNSFLYPVILLLPPALIRSQASHSSSHVSLCLGAFSLHRISVPLKLDRLQLLCLQLTWMHLGSLSTKCHSHTTCILFTKPELLTKLVNQTKAEWKSKKWQVPVKCHVVETASKLSSSFIRDQLDVFHHAPCHAVSEE